MSSNGQTFMTETLVFTDWWLVVVVKVAHGHALQLNTRYNFSAVTRCLICRVDQDTLALIITVWNYLLDIINKRNRKSTKSCKDRKKKLIVQENTSMWAETFPLRPETREELVLFDRRSETWIQCLFTCDKEDMTLLIYVSYCAVSL